MQINKKNIKKIKHATQEDLDKLQEGYKTVNKSVSGMSVFGLAAIAIAGILVILSFQSKFLVIIGLIMLLWPLYIFIRRGAHREGYFEGYYEMMTKFSSRDENINSKEPNRK